MRGDAYTVYYYCAKDGCRHSLAVFGVLGRAHDDVVAAGEHAADGAEDYDGEDGDDDAVGCWISGGSRALYIFPAIFLHVASFSIFLSGSSVPCPCVEGGNDGLHGCWLCCLIGRWDGFARVGVGGELGVGGSRRCCRYNRGIAGED